MKNSMMLILVLTVFCASELFSQSLSVSIELEKKVFTEAEEVNLLIKAKNISSAEVLMPPFSTFLTDYGIEIILKDDQERTIPPSMYTRGSGTPNFIVLSPNDSVSTFEDLSSIYGFNDYQKRSKAIQYLFNGKYKVQVLYHHWNPEGKTEQERSMDYRSNEIEFEVVPPKDEKGKEAHDEIVSQEWGPSAEKKYIEFLDKYPDLDVSKTIYSKLISMSNASGNQEKDKYVKKLLVNFPDSFSALLDLAYSSDAASLLMDKDVSQRISNSKLKEYYKLTISGKKLKMKKLFN